jgi:hypothetical protein
MPIHRPRVGKTTPVPRRARMRRALIAKNNLGNSKSTKRSNSGRRPTSSISNSRRRKEKSTTSNRNKESNCSNKEGGNNK